MWEMGDAQRLKADPLRSVVAECLMTLLGRLQTARASDRVGLAGSLWLPQARVGRPFNDPAK
jgi:hypothetical protein